MSLLDDLQFPIGCKALPSILAGGLQHGQTWLPSLLLRLLQQTLVDERCHLIEHRSRSAYTGTVSGSVIVRRRSVIHQRLVRSYPARGQGRRVGKGKKDTGDLYKALMVAIRGIVWPARAPKRTVQGLHRLQGTTTDEDPKPPEDPLRRFLEAA